jgi:flagellar basal body-associated protein FliL
MHGEDGKTTTTTIIIIIVIVIVIVIVIIVIIIIIMIMIHEDMGKNFQLHSCIYNANLSCTSS